MQPQWYLVRTSGGEESLAQAQLERQGYAPYYPKLVRMAVKRGKRMQLVEPLFPGYMFLPIEVGTQCLSPVKSTQGVLCLVRFGETYATVASEVVVALQGWADTDGFHRLASDKRTPHSPVRITRGPFANLEGIYLRDSGGDRVVVLLSILGQDTPVAVDEGWFEFTRPLHRAVVVN